jgi:hypothetical protein
VGAWVHVHAKKDSLVAYLEIVQFLCSQIDKPICQLPPCRLAVLPIAAIAYFAALDTSNGHIKMDYGQSAIQLVILPNHIK